MPFARTKIQPPRPWSRHPVPRTRLLARLAAAPATPRLVLLCAPAGYGKTSLLAQWLTTLDTRTAVAWVGCDEDDTPLRLFACLLAALEPFDLPFRLAPEALAAEAAGAHSCAARRRLAQLMVNAMDAADVPHGVLVVDDLHRVSHPEVHEFVGALLDHWPPRWTMVVATRSVPPWPLARLRAREQLLELQAADLAFDAGETASGAALHGLSAREQEVLAHIAVGDSNKLIARALDLSPHTVKRHVANILDKLALASRGQAAAWYRAHEPRA